VSDWKKKRKVRGERAEWDNVQNISGLFQPPTASSESWTRALLPKLQARQTDSSEKRVPDTAVLRPLDRASSPFLARVRLSRLQLRKERSCIVIRQHTSLVSRLPRSASEYGGGLTASPADSGLFQPPTARVAAAPLRVLEKWGKRRQLTNSSRLSSFI
jgi:hypothetical protein